MSNITQYYRQLLTSLTQRLQQGERDINRLVEEARQALERAESLTSAETDKLLVALRRDLQVFADNYTQHIDAQQSGQESLFMQAIRASLWQELADITDKTRLEWHAVFKDLSHHGIYTSGEVVGLGELVCENCHHHHPIYSPEVLGKCLKCGHDQFTRRPLMP
jgi:uncharacterized protein with von Willebrand factor type A (vWA) domain